MRHLPVFESRRTTLPVRFGLVASISRPRPRFRSRRRRTGPRVWSAPPPGTPRLDLVRRRRAVLPNAEPHPERLGGSGFGQVLVEPQDDHRPLAGGKLGKSQEEAMALEHLLLAGRVAPARGRTPIRLAVLDRLATSPRPQLVDDRPPQVGTLVGDSSAFPVRPDLGEGLGHGLFSAVLSPHNR